MEDQFVCHNCKKKTLRNSRHKNQKYCSSKACQKARKAKWQRDKLKSDSDYRKNQKEASRAWREENPDYYREYRKKNPEKAERNRLLQKVRRVKEKVSKEQEQDPNVAKMDVSKAHIIDLQGVYWLIPVAKMDASRRIIPMISTG